MNQLRYALVALILTLVSFFNPVSSTVHAETINTIAPTDVTLTGFGSKGNTFGQTFTVGADNLLSSFTFALLNRDAGSGPLELRGYIATWTGTGLGVFLYGSEIQTMNANGDPQLFEFDTDELILQSGTQYLAFFSALEFNTQPESKFNMPVSTDNYAGGTLVGTSAQTISQLAVANWACAACSSWDAWFVAELVPSSASVPEPATLLLFGAGMLILGIRSSRTLLPTRHRPLP